MVDNSSPISETWQELYQVGIHSFERGDYKQAIAQFQQALNDTNAKTKIGGEIQVWLANAHDAAGNSTEAIAICRSLKTHSDRDVRKSANYVLGILSAPKLNSLKDANSQIPSLQELDSQSQSQPTIGSGYTSQIKPKNQVSSIPNVDAQTSQREQNLFIVITIAIALTSLLILAIS